MWLNPIPSFKLIGTMDGLSYLGFEDDETGIPLALHPGAFGVRRKHHTHEGVDLYCPEGTAVRAVEDGLVVALEKFTGEHATPPSPWWNDTEGLLIEGMSGVVVYGEITSIREPGDLVKAGDLLGYVIEVLKEDKGRPTSMLHLELHRTGTRATVEWTGEHPASLLNPSTHLLEAAVRHSNSN